MNRSLSRFLYPILDLLFYGNFWIALCAAAMVIQTNAILHAEYLIDPITYLVFGGTLFIYGMHRALGIIRLKDFLAEQRYGVIYFYRNHIRVYAVLGLLISTFYFFLLDRSTQIFLIVPALLSGLYVIPVFGKKRLRDFNHVKIYVIALVFSGLTVLLPNYFLKADWDLSLVLLAIERFLFIFLLTLPFDIRDLKVDQFGQVATIPSRFGISITKKIMIATLLGIFGCLLANLAIGLYTMPQVLSLLLSSLLALLLGLNAKPGRHDYYFTGAIDGMMILQASLLILAMSLF